MMYVAGILESTFQVGFDNVGLRSLALGGMLVTG